MSMLLEKQGSANPLWLTLACEELRVYGVFNLMDEKIASLSDDLIRWVTATASAVAMKDSSSPTCLGKRQICLLYYFKFGRTSSDSVWRRKRRSSCSSHSMSIGDVTTRSAGNRTAPDAGGRIHTYPTPLRRGWIRSDHNNRSNNDWLRWAEVVCLPTGSSYQIFKLQVKDSINYWTTSRRWRRDLSQ